MNRTFAPVHQTTLGVQDGNVAVFNGIPAKPLGLDLSRVADVTDVPAAPAERLQPWRGLEDGITLVIAKSVLGLLEAGVSPAEIVRTGVEFGAAYRNTGWGAGLTVLVAMANLLPHLHPL